MLKTVSTIFTGLYFSISINHIIKSSQAWHFQKASGFMPQIHILPLKVFFSFSMTESAKPTESSASS